jgi:acetyl/propionyl-CoA carboxylase alpha subunit
MAKKISLLAGKRQYRLSVALDQARIDLKAESEESGVLEASAVIDIDWPWVIAHRDGTTHRCAVARDASGIWVSVRGRSFHFENARSRAGSASASESLADEVRAPMTGTIIAVKVAPGAAVKKGDLLVVMEAMKMEYRLEAEVDGEVARVECAPGDMLDVGTLLVKIEAPAAG